MKVIYQVFCVIFSAIMLVLGIPNEIFLFGCPFIALFSLIPFYIAYTKFSSPFNAAAMTGLFVFLVHLGSSYWLSFFKDFAIFTLGASAIGTGGIGCCIGLILYSPFLRYKKYNTLRITNSPMFSAFIPFRVLWFCVVYILYEWVKSCGWFGYPWGTVSSCFYRFKILIQIVDITGTYGVSFIAIFFAAVIGEGILSLRFQPKNISNTHRANKTTPTPKSKNKIITIDKTTSQMNDAICQLSKVFIALFVLSFIYGVYQFTKTSLPIKYLNAIMVQQNSDPWKESTDDESILLSQKLTREKLEEARLSGINIDLIVWSEGCLKKNFPNALYYYDNAPASSPLLPFISENGIPILLGGAYVERREPRRVVNAAMLFDKNAALAGVYGKNHLVPCAEVLPFSDIPAVSNFWKKTIGISAGWATGNQYVYFDIPCTSALKLPSISKTIYLDKNNVLLTQTQSNKPYFKRFEQEKNKEEENKDNSTNGNNKTNPKNTPLLKNNSRTQNPPYIDPEDFIAPLDTPPSRVRFSTPVCFDDSFPDVCRPLVNYGSELFMNITDDSWSKTKSSEYQHFVIAAFRTIELRTTLARSTNSGYSVIVNNKGCIIDDLPLFESCAGIFKIPIYKRVKTTYLKLGNWLPYTCLIIVVLLELYYLFTMSRPVEVNGTRDLPLKKSRKILNTRTK